MPTLSFIILFLSQILLYKQIVNGVFMCYNDEITRNYIGCMQEKCCWDSILTTGLDLCVDCTSNPTGVPTSSPFLHPTSSPVSTVVTEKIGDTCYCSTLDDEGTTAPTSSPTSSPTGGKTKKKKSSSGLGYGDCDCDKDYGLIEIRMRSDVNLTISALHFYYAGVNSEIVCNFTDLHYGEEYTCNIWDYNAATGSTYTDFDTNTYFHMYVDGAIWCWGKFHTSCSSDIVGTYSFNEDTSLDGGYSCEQIFCTGWKDGNPSDNNTCDDGMDICECTPTSKPTVAPVKSTTTLNPTGPPTDVSVSPTVSPTIDPTSGPTDVSASPTISPTVVPTHNPTTKEPTPDPTVFSCDNVVNTDCYKYQDLCCLTFVNEASNVYVCRDTSNLMGCMSCLSLLNWNCYDWLGCCTYHDSSGTLLCGTSTDLAASGMSCDVTDSPTTASPVFSPTYSPTSDPITDPTDAPTGDPTTDPTNAPTGDPITDPTNAPTDDPITDPTDDATTDPTNSPTDDPITDPTDDLTTNPTNDPTKEPTDDPTTVPTISPADGQTYPDPTISPTDDPTTEPPSMSPGYTGNNDPTMSPGYTGKNDPTMSPVKTGSVDDSAGYSFIGSVYVSVFIAIVVAYFNF